MPLLKSFKNEALIKEDLVKYYKVHYSHINKFVLNFMAHKTIDYLYSKNLLKVEDK